jgi:hypothetical protein
MTPLVIAYVTRVSLQFFDVERAVAQELVGPSEVTLQRGREFEAILISTRPLVVFNTLGFEPDHHCIV